MNNNELFVTLVSSLTSQAWMQLGKIKNPVTDKIEKNLDAASMSIDMLSMLQEKTKQLIQQKLEYMSETKKEVIEFIEQMNTKQFQDVQQFFDTMPKLKHAIKVKNPKTKVESEVTLNGLADFFV